jgi:response regulator NasT
MTGGDHKRAAGKWLIARELQMRLLLARILFAGIRELHVEPGMRLALISDRPGHHADLTAAAGRSGWDVVCEADCGQVPEVCARLQPDAAVVVARRVDARVLQAVRGLNVPRALPVVLFTGDSTPQSIRAAVTAGVSAYAVDCSNVNRIGALLELALARFDEWQQLRRELQRARTSLAERNSVEKAKGIIMRQRKVSEDTAYRMLRKLAMDRNRRIGEVAGEVIALAGVLI